MKKATTGLVLILILVVATLVQAAPAKEVKINVQGKPLTLSAQPVMENGRLLVPVRPIFEALGATVKWDRVSRTVYAEEDYFLVKVTIDNTTASINGYLEKLDVPARIINDVTMVPVRFAGEAFGALVNWDSKTSTVNIYYRQPASLKVDRTEEEVVLGQDVSIRNYTLLPGGSLFIEAYKPAGEKAKESCVLLYYFDVEKKAVSEVASFAYNDFARGGKPLLLPDGKLLVAGEKQTGTASEDKTVFYTYDPGTGAWQERFTVPAGLNRLNVSGRGEVLYNIQDNKQEDLYKTGLDGKSIRLTNTPDLWESRAVWSPDGKKIAFITDSTKNIIPTYMSVMNADGTGQVKFSFPALAATAFAWTNDNQYLVYNLSGQKENSGIWTIKADGTGAKRILKTDMVLNAITWSPDGSKFSAATGDGGFIVLNKDGAGLKSFRGANAAWSPDSVTLLNVRYGELWLWEAAGDKGSLLLYDNVANAVWGASQREIYTGSGNKIWKTILKAVK